MLSKKARLFVAANWQRSLVILLITGVILFIFTWRLGSITPGLSPAERSARESSRTVQRIVDNPLYAPHKLVQYGAHKLGHHESAAMRLASVIFALIALACFFMVIRWWFGSVLAIFGSILFAGSPWFIIAARSATPDIMLLIPVSVFACFLWLEQTERRHDLALLFLVICGALSLYVPGVVWIAIVGAFLCWPKLRAGIRNTSRPVSVLIGLLGVLLLVPLFYSLLQDTALIRQTLLLPAEFNYSVVGTAQAIIWAGLGLVWKVRDNLPATLGQQPVLNAMEIILAAVGAGWLLTQFRRRRTYILLGALGVSLIAIGILKDYSRLLLVLPILYIFITAGLAYFYNEWFRVFPRNPFARALGMVAISLVVALSALYGVRYSLLAWPRAPETKQVYMLQ